MLLKGHGLKDRWRAPQIPVAKLTYIKNTQVRYIATTPKNEPWAAQVLPCRDPAPRTNDVVQEEAVGLLYALLFVLCCNFALRL